MFNCHANEPKKNSLFNTPQNLSQNDTGNEIPNDEIELSNTPEQPPTFKKRAMKRKQNRSNQEEDNQDAQALELERQINTLNRPIIQMNIQNIYNNPNIEKIQHPDIMMKNLPNQATNHKNTTSKKSTQNSDRDTPFDFDKALRTSQKSKKKVVKFEDKFKLMPFFAQMLNLRKDQAHQKKAIQKSFIEFAIKYDLVVTFKEYPGDYMQSEHIYRIPQDHRDPRVDWIYKKVVEYQTTNDLNQIFYVDDPKVQGTKMIAFNPKHLISLIQVFVVKTL